MTEGTTEPPAPGGPRELRIRGYASRFGERDLGGDVVRPGAFAASLLLRPAPRPMLFDHDTDAPVGVWSRLVEDAVGLWAEGRILGGTAEADRLLALVASGAVSGLSIGYRTVRARETTTPGTAASGTAGRDLLELTLEEVSVVTFPMLPTARLSVVEADPPSTTPATAPATSPIHPSTHHPSIHQPIHPSIHSLPIHLSIHQPTHPFIHKPTHPSIHPTTCPSTTSMH